MSTMADLLRSDGPVQLDAATLSGWSPRLDVTVTREQIARYAEVVADPWPQRRDGQQGPPTFAFVPFTELLFTAVRELVGDGGVARLVHTHQDFELHRLLRPGDRLAVTGAVTRLHPGPLGAVLEVESTLVADDGELVTTQRARCLVAGATCVEPLGEPFPAGGSGSERTTPTGTTPTGTTQLAVPPDLPARYAEVSGDTNPIHLVPALAQALGFPGVIVHGMATLAMSVAALEAAGPGGVPVRLRAEFTRPVFPGDRLTVRRHDAPDGPDGPDAPDAPDGRAPGPDGLREIGFEVHNRRRRAVLRGGALTLAPVR